MKQPIFFSFILSNDYNPRVVKMDLFFCLFIVFMTINALFFNDNTMHQIYIDRSSYNFVYQIPQIIYFSLLSFVFNFIINFLALIEENIIKLKKIKDNFKINRKKSIIFSKINAYFIISTIYLLAFFYYLCCFCAVYENTKIHLIKDTLTSFGLQMIYSILLSLLSGLFRSCALKRENKRILYQISKILLFFC